MVVGSTSISEASPVGRDEAEMGQAVFTRERLTRNSMSSDWHRRSPQLAYSWCQPPPPGWRPSLT